MFNSARNYPNTKCVWFISPVISEDEYPKFIEASSEKKSNCEIF